jgi:hypothetical protein
LSHAPTAFGRVWKAVQLFLAMLGINLPNAHKENWKTTGTFLRRKVRWIWHNVFLQIILFSFNVMRLLQGLSLARGKFALYRCPLYSFVYQVPNDYYILLYVLWINKLILPWIHKALHHIENLKYQTNPHLIGGIKF